MKYAIPCYGEDSRLYLFLRFKKRSRIPESASVLIVFMLIFEHPSKVERIPQYCDLLLRIACYMTLVIAFGVFP